ncbi:hypothetical protein ABH945_006942 [Paraburkholderia sp. GAS333]|uniref:hypothetical protein n=1 Tax=Paraburkholderia sp. GAS333 TaxID=3156279 RepID=UPI003D231C8D
MSIGKQIQVFLEVSELFFRQSVAEVMNDGWPLVGAASGAPATQMLAMGTLLAFGGVTFSASSGNGVEDGVVMPANRQDAI